MKVFVCLTSIFPFFSLYIFFGCQAEAEMTQMSFNRIKIIRGQLKWKRILSFYCHSFEKKRRFAALHIQGGPSIYTSVVCRFYSQVLQMLTTLSAVT